MKDLIEGWLLDVYLDERQNKMVIWIKNSNGNIKIWMNFTLLSTSIPLNLS
ncbi:MAG: hypothetical protein QXJ68_05285 [Methanocellales archaeon]